jgi:hypothetical protein
MTRAEKIRRVWRHVAHDEPNPPTWLMFLFRPALWVGVASLVFAVVRFSSGDAFDGLGSLMLASGFARWAWAEARG